MAKLPTCEEVGKKVAEEALDGYVYKGKTLREWIELLAQTSWIPVSEKLPEEGEEVLVWYEYLRYGEHGCMYQTYGIGYQYEGVWCGSVSGEKARCIAWMPLPAPFEPPESEE